MVTVVYLQTLDYEVQPSLPIEVIDFVAKSTEILVETISVQVQRQAIVHKNVQEAKIAFRNDLNLVD